MRQGLLFKESPEPRFELYCESYSERKKCNILFSSVEELEQHKLEVHQVIPGKFYRERQWYSEEYLKRDGFTPLRFQLPVRPTRRFNITNEMLENVGGRMPGLKRCWCGKPRDEWDSRHFQTYCSDKHRDEWWDMTDYVGPHKNKFLANHEVCENCDKKGPKTGWNTHSLEMDHIIALVFGGHPWHEDNLQALCSTCHKVKTKSDVGILAWWKRQQKYDLGPIVKIITLEEFIFSNS